FRDMGQHFGKETCLPISNETGGEVLTLPENIVPSSTLRPLVIKLLATSIIFRRQCQTLSQAANLRITIETIHPAEIVCYRALTTFTREGRQVTARIHIVVPTRRVAELLGHEFEHVLEMLEGVNWKGLSTQKRSGVFSVGENLYETRRAIQ